MKQRNYNELRENFRENFDKLINLADPLLYSKIEEFFDKLILVNLYAKKVLPKNLYRYRGNSEYSIKAFQNDEIYLSQPQTFNDPFDPLVYIDQTTFANAFYNYFQPQLSSIIRKIQNDHKLSNVLPSLTNNIELVIKRNPINKLETIMKNLAFDNYSSIQDYTRIELNRAVHIGSFSELNDSILMWSHYANSHKGFVLGYDFRGVYDKFFGHLIDNQINPRKLFPVTYKDYRFDASVYASILLKNKILNKFNFQDNFVWGDFIFWHKSALHKYNVWQYEKEWRIIKPITEIGKNDLYLHDFNLRPKSIHLGYEIDIELEQKLISIARSKHLEIYKMKVLSNSKSFDLIAEKLNNAV